MEHHKASNTLLSLGRALQASQQYERAGWEVVEADAEFVQSRSTGWRKCDQEEKGDGVPGTLHRLGKTVGADASTGRPRKYRVPPLSLSFCRRRFILFPRHELHYICIHWLCGRSRRLPSSSPRPWTPTYLPACRLFPAMPCHTIPYHTLPCLGPALFCPWPPVR
ncbi:hypothetical protein LZ30DRAFT_718812 [Colletotrichum cereale]|nr:hypothetical protein LZ30DRAFT_718812 [Colletotrichum cereale]